MVWRAPLAALVAVCCVLVAPAPGAQAQLAPTPHQHYELPIESGVLRPFEAPRTRFGAGHRGVDLGVEVGAVVRAASHGHVRFAGTVAGVGWVSIDHDDGVTTSYGPLTTRVVRAGEMVRLGQPLGRLAPGGHGDGGLDRGLHVGARTAAGYFDPLSLLGPPPVRPSLVGPGGWWVGREGPADARRGPSSVPLAPPAWAPPRPPPERAEHPPVPVTRVPPGTPDASQRAPTPSAHRWTPA